MSDFLQQLRLVVLDNFASALFLLIVGTIALLFIGYLVMDFIRTKMLIRRTRKRHREERRQRQHVSG